MKILAILKNRRSCAVLLIAAILAIGVLTVASNFRASTGSQQPALLVEWQQDVPLNITLVKQDISDPLKPRIHLNVTNITDKPIRAFTISYAIKSANAEGTGAHRVNLSALERAIRPTQSKQVTIGSEVFEKPVESITFSVDFVELTDGTRWGPDRHQTAEGLDGQRAGGHAALEHYRKILREKGMPLLRNLLTGQETFLAIPTGHTPEWEMGFRTGLTLVKNRLRQAKNSGGDKAIESELSHPFDASEGRERP